MPAALKSPAAIGGVRPAASIVRTNRRRESRLLVTCPTSSRIVCSSMSSLPSASACDLVIRDLTARQSRRPIRLQRPRLLFRRQAQVATIHLLLAYGQQQPTA